MNDDLSCRECREALVEFTAGTLPTAQRNAVERHLASCPDCQRERDIWLIAGQAIHAHSQQIPTDTGYAAGLLRLRAALSLEDHDFEHFEHPEGEDSSMERDPRLSERRAPTAQHDPDGPDIRASVRPARLRPIAAVTATMAVVLLAALLFTTLATRPRSGTGPGSSSATATATSSPATNATPQPVPPLPGNVSVYGIAMLSATEGWATGTDGHGTGLFLRYMGGQWTPTDDQFPGTNIGSISMDAPDDGWAVGTHPDQDSGVVLHYSGGHWSTVETPKVQFVGSQVWALSPSQALVLGLTSKDATGNLGSVLLRYDSGAWMVIKSPRGISRASLLGPDDLWAACWDGHVMWYHASTWTTYSIGGQTAGQGGQPLSIAMLSDTDGWVSGFSNDSPQGVFLAHFDGHAWTRVPGPVAGGVTDIITMAMVSPTEGWAGGDLMTGPAGTGPMLLHYTGGQWQAVPVPYSGAFNTIDMISPSEGWATFGDSTAMGLLHYQNGQWTAYRPTA